MNLIFFFSCLVKHSMSLFSRREKVTILLGKEKVVWASSSSSSASSPSGQQNNKSVYTTLLAREVLKKGREGLIDSDHTFPKVLNNKEEVGKVANSSFLLPRSGVRPG